jgi:hypothetical protein
MQQARDGLDTEPAELRQSLVGPAPIADIRGIGRDGFPQDRVAHRFDSERLKSGEIFVSISMPGFVNQVSKGVPNPNNGAFKSAP